MSQSIIKVENLGKTYKIGKTEPYYSLRDTIAGVFDFKRKTAPEQIFHALKGLNLEVNQGDTLGIIGRNGAGKSTLLKILSQITPPTTGKITMRGRVASLLEVGTGFHPELTGRENIYLNGAILGMTQKEIRQKFDQIVDFSEIEKFLDTPVKRYSSGMYVRLAFAVAAQLEPEILIIDEVLAVGDVKFQQKSLGKMHDIAKGGRTVIFVSHNLGAVNQLCEKAILLKNGEITCQGPSLEVTKKYFETGAKDETVYKQAKNVDKVMNLRKVSIYPYIENNIIHYDEDIKILIEYEVNQPISNALVWIDLKAIDGLTVFCSADYDLHPDLREKRKPGYYKSIVTIPKKWLTTNTYSLTVGINTNGLAPEVFDHRETIKFELIDNGTTPKSMFGEAARTGVLQPFLDWETVKVR